LSKDSKLLSLHSTEPRLNMAAIYSQCRTWWRILRILFVLLATVAQCREFVEDIVFNGRQDLNSTPPAVKVGTPPPRPFDKSPEEETYQNAIDKGEHILAAESKTLNIC